MTNWSTVCLSNYLSSRKYYHGTIEIEINVITYNHNLSCIHWDLKYNIISLNQIFFFFTFSASSTFLHLWTEDSQCIVLSTTMATLPLLLPALVYIGRRDGKEVDICLGLLLHLSQAALGRRYGPLSAQSRHCPLPPPPRKHNHGIRYKRNSWIQI